MPRQVIGLSGGEYSQRKRHPHTAQYLAVQPNTRQYECSARTPISNVHAGILTACGRVPPSLARTHSLGEARNDHVTKQVRFCGAVGPSTPCGPRTRGGIGCYVCERGSPCRPARPNEGGMTWQKTSFVPLTVNRPSHLEAKWVFPA